MTTPNSDADKVRRTAKPILFARCPLADPITDLDDIVKLILAPRPPRSEEP